MHKPTYLVMLKTCNSPRDSAVSYYAQSVTASIASQTLPLLALHKKNTAGHSATRTRISLMPSNS